MLQLTEEQRQSILEALSLAHTVIDTFEDDCSDDGLLEESQDARLAIGAAEDILDPGPVDA